MCIVSANGQSRRIRLVSNTFESGRGDIRGRSDYRQFFFGQRRGLGISIKVEEKGRGQLKRVRVPETFGGIVLICGGGDVG